MPSLILKHNPNVTGTIGKLPASKSISNRVLILDALSRNKSTIRNLANARDTKLMKDLLHSEAEVIDAMDAGTTMRFLTAHFAISGQKKILTGTSRMKERPIRLLVDALRHIGASIQYLEQEGFPPIKVIGFPGQKSKAVSLPANISSQYISALMMVAPTLPQGLTIDLRGTVASRPYIEMTASLMKAFGVESQFDGEQILISHGNYQPTTVDVEPDWSALSYWFAMAALAEKGDLVLKGVHETSLQGDRVIVEIMEKLGVKTHFKKGDAILSKTEHVTPELVWDFHDCPDLAQTVLPVCALKGVKGTFTGLESLYIKETDRIAALQNELGKVGAKLERKGDAFHFSPGTIPKTKIMINTYHDHRMAMGFAPWATLVDLEIEDLEVVNKSYPDFWNDLKSIGFQYG